MDVNICIYYNGNDNIRVYVQTFPTHHFVHEMLAMHGGKLATFCLSVFVFLMRQSVLVSVSVSVSFGEVIF